MIHLTEIIKNSRVSLFPSALNSGAHFSSLLINVLYGILFFFQNRALSSALKTCPDRYLFSSMTFLIASGNFSAASWLAEAASPVILTFF